MALPQVQYMSPREYLEHEAAAEYKSEYLNSVLYAMAGGTGPHSIISVNVVTALNNALEGRRCPVRNSDVQIAITPDGPFFYPDASVSCGRTRYVDAGQRSLLNPVVIVEVLSDSTRGVDRGRKMILYKQIESLQEYLLVEQDTALVNHYRRDGEGWHLTPYRGLDAEIPLPSIECVLRVADLYRNTPVDPDFQEPE